MSSVDDKRKAIRVHFQNDLYAFAVYINPTYMYGSLHQEVFKSLQEDEDDEKILFLLPRAHLKSHCIAVWVVWLITRFPWTSILYTSANDDLVKVQMSAIQSMLTSAQYRKLWPEMIHPQEAKREKWSESAISVDHPLRARMGTRDWTLSMRTIKASSVGLHCDFLIADDIVTDRNAYTPLGRKEVIEGISSYIGIKNPGAKMRAVGTRYHPQDVYGMWQDAKEPILNDLGDTIGEQKQWKIIQAVVEDSGYGNGEFLWPRVKSPITSQWYGFNAKVLAHKKAEYSSLGQVAQFYSQFYNEPNDPGSDRIQEDVFQYLNKKLLRKIGGRWHYDGKKLNVFAAMDLAFTDDIGTNRADFSAIVVIGVDWEGFIYVLALDAYKTSSYQIHYDKLIELYERWMWTSLRIETNSAGKLVDREIKRLLRQNGKTMSIDSYAKTRRDGSKAERYALILEPRYEQGIIYHTEGGHTASLEDQVRKSRPKNDDLKDALVDAIDQIKLPPRPYVGTTLHGSSLYCPDARFGGKRRMR